MKHYFRIDACSLKMIWVVLIAAVIQFYPCSDIKAQIWEPEGLNMPGAWNGWTNPPTNNLALASSTQVSGGRILKFSTGIQRWQTILKVAESGGDLTGGSYEWLFASGSNSNPWGNKWAAVNVIFDSLQTYTYNTGANNTITLENGKWYTMNWEDAGYNGTRAIFMRTSAEPVQISGVSVPGTVNPNEAATITLTLSGTPSSEEIFYLRYSADAWATSVCLPFLMTGSSGTAIIPGQLAGDTVSYYAFSSTKPGLSDLYDLFTIRMNNNGGTNYLYTVTSPTPVITFCNLQSPAVGNIEPGQTFNVTGHVLIPGITGGPVQTPGLEAWIGWSGTNTNPSGWTNWIPAQYISPSSFFDVFLENLGSSMGATGTWYYATRFRYNGGSYQFGGYSATGGGFWDGINNISGVLTVIPSSVPLNRTLQNVSVEPEQLVCFDATNTITIAGGETFFKVLNGGAVTLVAGQKILLLQGTGVANGGYLRAYITQNGQYCGSTGKSAFASNNEDEGTNICHSEFRFKVFPNPVSDWLNLDIPEGTFPEVIHLKIFDLRGKLIENQTLSASGTHRISLVDYPSGSYLLQIIQGDKIQHIKLIKHQ